MRLYRNNELVASVAEAGDVAQAPTVAVGIGNQPAGAGDRPFNGLIDDLRLYGAALTESELEDLYADDQALPVSWRYFTGAAVGKTAVLRWETVSEESNAGFYVERGQYGDFEEVGFVPPATAPYLFVDDSPVFGENTYRLRQVDVNGRITYSQLLTLRFQSDFALYPVPTRDLLTIETNTGSYYQVVNSVGQETASGKLFEARTQVLCEDWKSGVYIVRLLDDNGAIISERKIIRL